MTTEAPIALTVKTGDQPTSIDNPADESKNSDPTERFKRETIDNKTPLCLINELVRFNKVRS
jgi:hypothetical protein